MKRSLSQLQGNIASGQEVPDDIVALRNVGQYSAGDGPQTIVFVLGTKAHQEQVRKDLSNSDLHQVSPKIYNQRRRPE